MEQKSLPNVEGVVAQFSSSFIASENNSTDQDEFVDLDL